MLIEHREGDRPHYVIETHKWQEEIGLAGDGMFDLKHIAARHGHPDSDGWPVSPGSEYEEDRDLFPKEWDVEKIKELIRRTIRDGEIGRNSGELVYPDPEFDKYQFDQVGLRRKPKNGLVQSFYPVYNERT